MGDPITIDVKVPYDSDVTWDDGCNGTDAYPDTDGTNWVSSEPVWERAPGDYYVIRFEISDEYVDVDMDPDKNNGFEYRLNRKEKTLSVWSDSGWVKASTLKSLDSLPPAITSNTSLFDYPRYLHDKDFGECFMSAALPEDGIAEFLGAYDDAVPVVVKNARLYREENEIQFGDVPTDSAY